MLDPITAREAITEVVVPPHVYVYAGAVPASVQATEHLSMTICRPFVPSVSSSDDGEAVVVRVGAPARSIVPVFESWKARWIVSPGAMPVAFTVRRLAAPAAPSAIVTEPLETVCVAVVELVNVANVPSPARLAAAASTASDARTLTEKLISG